MSGQSFFPVYRVDEVVFAPYEGKIYPTVHTTIGGQQVVQQRGYSALTEDGLVAIANITFTGLLPTGYFEPDAPPFGGKAIVGYEFFMSTAITIPADEFFDPALIVVSHDPDTQGEGTSGGVGFAGLTADGLASAFNQFVLGLAQGTPYVGIVEAADRVATVSDALSNFLGDSLQVLELGIGEFETISLDAYQTMSEELFRDTADNFVQALSDHLGGPDTSLAQSLYTGISMVLGTDGWLQFVQGRAMQSDAEGVVLVGLETARVTGSDQRDIIILPHGQVLDGLPQTIIQPGAGDDVILALGDRSVWVEASGGNNLVMLGSGSSMVLGGIGNDTVFGGTGGNFIAGNSGRNLLVGGSGNDAVFGGLGNDTLVGGGGTDLLDGGRGGLNTVRFDGRQEDFHLVHDLATGLGVVVDLRAPVGEGQIALMSRVHMVEFTDTTTTLQPGKFNTNGMVAFDADATEMVEQAMQHLQSQPGGADPLTLPQALADQVLDWMLTTPSVDGETHPLSFGAAPQSLGLADFHMFRLANPGGITVDGTQYSISVMPSGGYAVTSQPHSPGASPPTVTTYAVRPPLNPDTFSLVGLVDGKELPDGRIALLINEFAYTVMPPTLDGTVLMRLEAGRTVLQTVDPMSGNVEQSVIAVHFDTAPPALLHPTFAHMLAYSPGALLNLNDGALGVAWTEFVGPWQNFWSIPFPSSAIPSARGEMTVGLYDTSFGQLTQSLTYSDSVAMLRDYNYSFSTSGASATYTIPQLQIGMSVEGDLGVRFWTTAGDRPIEGAPVRQFFPSDYSLIDDGLEGLFETALALPQSEVIASISGDTSGLVVENDPDRVQVSGTLQVVNPDAGEDRFANIDPSALVGDFGTFTFDPATGAWSYTLDNDLDAVQALPEGVAVSDSLSVASLDGTASETITITITGTGLRGEFAPATVSASVQDRWGNPISDAAVQFTPDGTDPGALDVTPGDAGVFSFALDRGSSGDIDLIRDYDSDRDGGPGLRDALDVLRLSMGLSVSGRATEALDFIAADVNQDGVIDAQDSTAVLRAALALESDYGPRWVFINDAADLTALDRNNSTIETGFRVDEIDSDIADLAMTGILLGTMQEYA